MTPEKWQTNLSIYLGTFVTVLHLYSEADLLASINLAISNPSPLTTSKLTPPLLLPTDPLNQPILILGRNMHPPGTPNLALHNPPASRHPRKPRFLHPPPILLLHHRRLRIHMHDKRVTQTSRPPKRPPKPDMIPRHQQPIPIRHKSMRHHMRIRIPPARAIRGQRLQQLIQQQLAPLMHRPALIKAAHIDLAHRRNGEPPLLIVAHKPHHRRDIHRRRGRPCLGRTAGQDVREPLLGGVFLGRDARAVRLGGFEGADGCEGRGAEREGGVGGGEAVVERVGGGAGLGGLAGRDGQGAEGARGG